MVDIQDVQEEVAEWSGTNFPDTHLSTAALGTSEEIGELAEAVLGLVAEYGKVARAIVKGQQGYRGSAQAWATELRKELADCFIKLCDVSTRSGVDLNDAVLNRWNVVQQRVSGSTEEAARGPQSGLTVVNND